MPMLLLYKKGAFTLKEGEKVLVSSEKLNDILNATVSEKPLTLFIDAEEFSVRKATFPAIGIEKVKEILPLEMEGRFLLPSKELVFAPLMTESDEKGEHYLVFAVKRQLVTDIVLPLLNNGVKVEKVSVLDEEGILSIPPERTEELNFLPDELKRYSEKKVALGVVRKLVYYAAFVIIIIVAGLSFRIYFLSKNIDRLKKEAVTQYNTLFPDGKSADLKLEVLQARLMELKQTYKSLKGMELLDILKDMSIPVKGVQVKEVNIEKDRITIKGEGDGYPAIEQYKAAVAKRYPLLKMAETKKLSSGKMNFVLEASIAD